MKLLNAYRDLLSLQQPVICTTDAATFLQKLMRTSLLNALLIFKNTRKNPLTLTDETLL